MAEQNPKGIEKRGSPSAPRGFTLLELGIVLLLLGLILTLSLPRIREMIGPQDLPSAIRGLIGTIRYAQSQAAMTKQKYRLNLALRENRYWLSVEGNPGKFLREEGSLGKDQSLPRGVRFMGFLHPLRGKVQDGRVSIEFSPTGWVEECTIHLRQGEKEIFTLFIHPLGGKVEVLAGYGERVRG